MIIRNKKNGTNVLAFRVGVKNVRVPIRAGEEVNIYDLVEFDQVINKPDFTARGWFEIIEKQDSPIVSEEETTLEKAEKEVKKYASEKNEENN